jgi:hypothetical protein
MAKKSDTINERTIVLPPARGAFVHLIQPRQIKQQSGATKEQYEMVLLFPPNADLSAFKKAAAIAVGEEFPKGVPESFTKNLEPADKYKYDGFLPGWHRLQVNSKKQPGLVDAKVQRVIDDTQVFSGRWYSAQVRVYAYGADDPLKKKGIGCELLNVQLYPTPAGMPDDMFGNKVKAEDAFQAVEDGAAGASGDAGGKTAGGLFD